MAATKQTRWQSALALFLAFVMAVVPLNLDAALAGEASDGAAMASAGDTLDPGTYTITANLSMPGAYNPVLTGVSVYTNNPNNPFSDKEGGRPVLDGNSSEGVTAEVPSKAEEANATLVVATDGTKTLILPIKNPVFTTQSVGTCDSLSRVWVSRTKPADSNLWNYGKYATRINMLGAQLTDTKTSGTVNYYFKGSSLYAVPLSKDIAPDGDIALQLSVNYDEAQWVSDGTEITFEYTGDDGSAIGALADDSTDPDPDPDPTPSPDPDPDPTPDTPADFDWLNAAIKNAQTEAANVSVSTDGTDVAQEAKWVTQATMDNFTAAIASAQAVASNEKATQAQVDEALSVLNTAKEAFTAQVKQGTKANVTKVAKPSAATGLQYNGKAQTGVAAANGYTVTAGSATDAGTYTAVAKLNNGYVWSDGTTDALEVSWIIAKALLTATYTGETVSEDVIPTLGVEVKGFVNGETLLTAKDYVAPTVAAPTTLTAGKTYVLSPAGGKAANYQFTYVAGDLVVTKASTGTLKAGSYTITANLSMPGEYNPVIPGATVYANNPNNPFTDNAGHEPVLDGNSGVGVTSTTPTSPLSKNATLVADEDGTKWLELDILNPVFTTQELGTCSELANVQVTRKAPQDASVWSYGRYSTRISHVKAQLTDEMVSGTKEYTFSGSKLYAVPLDIDIAPTGDVALELSVNYSSLPDSAFEDGKRPTDSKDNETPGTDGGNNGGNNGGTNNNGGQNNNGNNNGSNNNGSNNNGGSNNNNGTNTNNGSSTNTNTNNGSTINTNANGSATHIAAGTYTVSANLWFDKSETGLPLNPHMTNGGFPPSTPVSDNATLTVDANGHATVNAPVLIQDKVMTINNVWGTGITYDGSSVTIDLGYPSSTDKTFTGTCSTSVTIGWLARTIAAGIFNGVWDHTWNTNWQVNLGDGLPSSGGGELPEAAKAILYGENGVSDEETATNAALAALDSMSGSDGGSASGSSSKSASGSSSSSKKGSSAGLAGSVEDLTEEMAHNPWLGYGLGALTTLVVAGAAAGGVYAYRKRKKPAADGEAESGAPEPPLASAIDPNATSQLSAVKNG